MLVDGGTDLRRQPIWIEGPHLFKRKNFYYLICAEGGTDDQHSEVVFRSAQARGPYKPYSANPILTQRQLDPARRNPITSTGHADMVKTQSGDWWAVFLGTRPYADDSYNTGRETFLMPVRWMRGWPVITRGREVLPYTHRRPALPPQPRGALPTSGNFAIRDDFHEPQLAPAWSFIRTPREQWYALKDGQLAIRPRHQSIGGFAQPSFIGRRQQHTNASVSTALHFDPRDMHDAAGLAAFQNDDYYFFLGVTAQNGQRRIVLKRRAGHNENAYGVVIASAPLDAAKDAPVYLRIDARGGRYDFYFATREGQWTALARDTDGSILSTKTAGGFVGTMLGMYAYTDEPQSP